MEATTLHSGINKSTNVLGSCRKIQGDLMQAFKNEKRLAKNRYLGTIRQAFRKALFAIAFVSLIAAAPSYADTLQFSTGNDIFAGNPFDDDRYSNSLDLTTTIRGHRFTLKENLFTDKDGGDRFDETWFGWQAPLADYKGWTTYAEIGVVHVGEGLLGQRAQNELHSWINDRPVELAYPDQEKFHPTVKLAGETLYSVSPNIRLIPEVELHAAAGFKYHAKGQVNALWNLRKRFSLHGALGLQITHTSFGPLRPFVEEFGPTMRLGMLLNKRWDINWTRNEYGTGARHMHISYRLPLGR